MQGEEVITATPTMSERALQDAVIECAGYLGWAHYHTHDSRRSVAGFPDLILVRGERLIAVELKSAKGVATKSQLEWLSALDAAGVECFVWRPSEWCDGTVERTLR